MATWSNDFLLAFIELFREQEVLWKIKDKDYHNQTKRNVSYNILLEKIKDVDASADINTVKKKINNIRTVFRKEFNKHEASKVSGSSTDGIYTSKLWYYNNLLFLRDQEKPYEKTSSSINTSDNQSDDDDQSRNQSIDDNDDNSQSIQSPNSDFADTQVLTSSRASSILSPPSTRNYKRKKSTEPTDNIDKTVQNINTRLSQIKPDDQFDVYGKNVTFKLRSLPKEQRIWAEKIINETLLEAEMGNLNRNCVNKITNIHNTLQSSTPSQASQSLYSQSHTAHLPAVQENTQGYSFQKLQTSRQSLTSQQSISAHYNYQQSVLQPHIQSQTETFHQSNHEENRYPTEQPIQIEIPENEMTNNPEDNQGTGMIRIYYNNLQL